MSLFTQAKVDTKGNITSPISSWRPSAQEKERVRQLQRDYVVSQTIMDKPYEEFGFDDNGGMMSLIQRLNYNQKKFNLYRPPRSSDPDLAWHSNALKPVIRNKVVSIVAHVTSQILYPDVIAQNDDAVEDKDMASVMQDAVLFACEQCKYEDKFIDMVQDMCVNPAVILFQDYAKVMRTVKEKIEGQTVESNEFIMKEVVDEVYSGFVMSLVPPDELYIANIYEPELQKQPFLIRRKIIDYTLAKQKYGKYKNFEYVKPGVTVFFDDNGDLFYEDHDDSLEYRLVSEITYYNRTADLEVTMVGGVLMCHPDNPMKRIDKKYPFAKSVYETFNSRFFYGMALVQKLEPDEDLLNTLYKMIIDGTYLQILPPVAVYGEQNMSAADFNPRSINAFSDPNVKVEPISLGGNLAAGYSALNLVEQSMGESSKQEFNPGSNTTAREISYIEDQTQISLGRTGKMVAKLVRDFGDLLTGSIIQYLSVAQMAEIAGDSTVLKFPKIFIPQSEGQEMSKRIEFTMDLPEADTEDDLYELEREGSYAILDEEEQDEMEIIRVRPDFFRELQYKCKVSTSFLSKSTKFAKSMMLFDRLLNDPLIDQRKLRIDTILKELKPGHENEYLVDEPDPVLQETSKMTAQPPTLNNQVFTEL